MYDIQLPMAEMTHRQTLEGTRIYPRVPMLPSRLDWMEGSLLDPVVLTKSKDCKELVYAPRCRWSWKEIGRRMIEKRF